MKYFFHITHNEPRVDDIEGVELTGEKAAWDEATKACGEMIRDIDGSLHMGSDWKMDVDDEDGPLFTVHFGAESRRPG